MALEIKIQNELKAKYPLAPCPHCGSISAPDFTTACECDICSATSDGCEQFIVDDGCDCNVHFVVCNAQKGGCGATSGWASSAEGAARNWNSRIPPHGDCWKCPTEIDMTCPYAGEPNGCNNRELGDRVRASLKTRFHQ